MTASAGGLGLQQIGYGGFSCRSFGCYHPHLPVSPYQLQVTAFPSQDDRMEIASVLQLSQVKDSHFSVKTSLLAYASSPNCTCMFRWAGSLGTWETENWNQKLDAAVLNLTKHLCGSPRKHPKLEILPCVAPIAQFSSHRAAAVWERRKTEFTI